MTDKNDKPRMGDEPGFVDGIPVEELVRLTREFTARITNDDRQRLARELNEGGRSIQTTTPYLLHQFFIGKIDLDVELAARFPTPPLMSSGSFSPQPGKSARHGMALFNNQDASASAVFEIHGTSFEVGFLLSGMISVRFSLPNIGDTQRARFVELMTRLNGIAFLWTKERWERDYLIFVVRERFARIYAFGPGRFEAACRMTPDMLEKLMSWLGGFWQTDIAPKTEEQSSDAW
jgi:hypothetical protein